MDMRIVWCLTAFVETELPVNDKRVLSVCSFEWVCYGDNPPDAETCRAWVEAHTRNVVLISVEVERKEIPEFLFEHIG